MKAIMTKYLGPTNTRGARIRVAAEGIKPKYVPYPSNAATAADAHHGVAVTYATERDWLTPNLELATGCLPDCKSYCHVFVKKGGAL